MLALGRHIIAELYECNVDKIDDVMFVEESMLAAADKAGATVINSTFHHFSPFGVSGVIVIQESHFSIHCWPEYAYASIDIFTCGDTVNPWLAYDYLKNVFCASHGSTLELNRGQHDLIGPSQKLTSQVKSERPVDKPNGIKKNRDVWFTQRDKDFAISLRHGGERVLKTKSKYQDIEILNTNAYGKVLALDGKIACAEADEYVYHEMIAHVPAFAHQKVKKALIIGGGDGGTARELLLHKEISKIDLVEIDEKVVHVAKKYLPKLSSAMRDTRLNLIFRDGKDFINDCEQNNYDLIILDSGEPFDVSAPLFTKKIFDQIFRLLKVDGVLIVQSESPRFNKQRFAGIYHLLAEVFSKNKVYPYLVYLSSYPSGMWSFLFCSKGDIHPFANINRKKINGFCDRQSLQYYNAEIHNAAFVLPNFVKNILK